MVGSPILRPGHTRPLRLLRAVAALGVGAAVVAGAASAAAGPERPDRPDLRPPTTLPGGHGTHGTDGAAEWIVAVRPGSAALGALLARRQGARSVDRVIGLYAAPEPAAGRLARALRAHGALWYAEPDVTARRAGLPADPLSSRQWWIPHIVPPRLVPPAPGGTPVGIVDSGVDVTHPDLAPHVTRGAPQRADHDPEHGTSVASVVASAANGVGIVGVLPGQPTAVFPSDASCAETVRALRLASAVANVINMSYGFDEGACFSHFLATQLAVSRGVLLVASAGNELQEDNEPSRPANDPHVLTVGALNESLASAIFSNQNIALDLTAPGVNIPVAVPVGSNASGYALADGTSFSAPIVAAIAHWLRRARPGLSADQAGNVLRSSARDLGPQGRDRSFGFGLVDIAAALVAPKPRRDPREPNEDIEFVNGRGGIPRQTPLLGRRRVERLNAALDATEDPVDVVPVRVRGRHVLQVTVVPKGADVDVDVFAPTARTVAYSRRPPRARLAAGRRAGLRRERVEIENPTRRTATVWVALFIGDRSLDAEYDLRLRSRRV